MEMNLQQVHQVVGSLKEYPNICDKLKHLEKEHLETKHSLETIPGELAVLSSREVELKKQSINYKKKLTIEEKLENAYKEMKTIAALEHIKKIIKVLKKIKKLNKR